MFLRVSHSYSMLLMTHVALFPTSLGDCRIAWRGDKVVATRLPDASSAETSRRLVAQTGGDVGDPPAAILDAIDLITALLEGERVDLTAIQCDLDGVDPFAAQVYAATRQIPAGETSTYGAIASQLGDMTLARGVGQALGRNPVPIIVPCHRIIGTDGKLVGFSASGGVQLKLKMLEIERAQIGDPPGLFEELPFAVKPRR